MSAICYENYSISAFKGKNSVYRFCRPIMTKPKPAAKPATPEAASPPPPPQGSEPQPQGAEKSNADGNENAGGAGSDAPQREPMETEKPDPAPGAA